MEYHIHKAAGILIQGRKLLVEKSINKQFYIAPGGSIEEGETPEIALQRELNEEFSIDVDLKDLEFFNTFYAEAAGQESKVVRMDVYFVKEWKGTVTASAEVEYIEWISSDNPNQLPLGSIFEHEVIPRLKKKDLID